MSALKKYMLSIVLANLFFAVTLYGQSLDRKVIGSAGQTLSTPTKSCVFTIGEPVVGIRKDVLVLHQGFHQEWAVVTSIGPNDDNLSFSVYPNPTIGELQIECNEALNIQLFSATGQHVLKKFLCEPNIVLDIRHLPAGHYRLVGSDQRGRSAVFMIIKN